MLNGQKQKCGVEWLQTEWLNRGTVEIVKLVLQNYVFGEADVTIQSGFDGWSAYGNIKGFIGVLGQMRFFYQSIR